jgi:hypothetical protein
MRAGEVSERPGMFGIRPSEPGGRGAISGILLLPVIAAGLAWVFLAVWVAELAGPTTPQRAVISRHDRTDAGDEAGTWSYELEARTEDGVALDIGASNSVKMYDSAGYGEPVVVYRSALTGRVVGVRTVTGYVDFHHHGGMIAIVVVASALVVAGTAGARRFMRLARPYLHPFVLVIVLASSAGVGAVALLDSPVIRGTQRLPDAMGIYAQQRFFPDEVAGTGDVVELAGFTIQVTGPVATAAPAGSPAWLRAFRVAVIPVRVTYHGTYDRGFERVTLIGTGRGFPQMVGDPACGGVPGAFDGNATAAAPQTAGPMCFVVPSGFQPRHLVIGTGADTVAVSLSPA